MLLGPRTVVYRRAFWFQQPDLLLIFWYSSTDQESVAPKRTSASLGCIMAATASPKKKREPKLKPYD